MGVISKYISVKITSYNIKRYKQKGYECDKEDIIMVYYKDLPKGDIKIICYCDYCNTEYTTTTSALFRKSENNKCCCNDKKCQQRKREETFIKKYGVDNPMKNKQIVEKVKETNIKKYGACNVMQNENIKNKFIKTMNEKYGVNYPMENKDIRIKAETIFLKKYNVKCPLLSPEIQEKIKNTLLLKYNTENPLYIKLDKLPDSKNERYIRNLYNGIPHIQIEKFYPDMLIEDNIIVEYDGSGHNIKEKYMTHSEYIKKENFREKIILKHGFKIIRLISKTDILPKDEVLINIKEIGKEYLKNNDIFKYDLDNNKQII